MLHNASAIESGHGLSFVCIMRHADPTIHAKNLSASDSCGGEAKRKARMYAYREFWKRFGWEMNRCQPQAVEKLEPPAGIEPATC